MDDLESIDALEEYVDGSQVIMIFVSAGYFKSANCLREVKAANSNPSPSPSPNPNPNPNPNLTHNPNQVKAAVTKAKPLSLVFDPVRGGAPLETIREVECPAELRDIFNGRSVIEWHRIKVADTP